MSKPLIRRYGTADRLMHWAVALGFVLLLITGYLIFFDGTASHLDNSSGNLSREIHRIAAVLFVAAPALYLIFSKKRFGWLLVFKWSKSDLGWLKAAPKHYFTGKSNMPEQPKYNTGQKLYYLCAVVFGAILALTGFALWFHWLSGIASFWLVVIHDLSAVIFVAFFFVHVYLTVFHPIERTSFNAMTTGWMDKEYASHHHGLWYKEEMKESKSRGK